jgi:hypothetical protein
LSEAKGMAIIMKKIIRIYIVLLSLFSFCIAIYGIILAQESSAILYLVEYNIFTIPGFTVFAVSLFYWSNLRISFKKILGINIIYPLVCYWVVWFFIFEIWYQDDLPHKIFGYFEEIINVIIVNVLILPVYIYNLLKKAD